MIDENELRLWISRLETEESSWNNYEKLAALYIIQNQHKKTPESTAAPVMYSAAAAPAVVASADVGEYGDTDFLRAVAGKDPAKAWAVVDELMDTLRIVNERVYNSVMRKIQAL